MKAAAPRVMGCRVLRSVRAVKARAVTARRGEELRVRVVCGAMRYTMIRIRPGSQGGEEEEEQRSQGDGGVVVDESEEAEGGRQGVAVYTYTHTGSPRPRSGYLNNSQAASTRQGTQSASLRVRGRISTPGQARETTICSGFATLRQCAQALLAVSTGRQSRDVLKPSKAPPIIHPPDARSTPATLGAVPALASRWYG
jgi:hypothetical protein